MTEDDYEEWLPLTELAELDWAPSLRQLQEWSRKRETNSFPEPKETLGKYHFYDPSEVKRWCHLWQKVTKNMGNSNLNSRERA